MPRIVMPEVTTFGSRCLASTQFSLTFRVKDFVFSLSLPWICMLYGRELTRIIFVAAVS